MKKITLSWNRLGISKKFNLTFSLLLFFILLIAATAYFALLSIRNAEDDIRKSTEIRLQVLEMDRGMERAHRLLSDFFLNHQSIGLQKAHQQYAQPSARQLAQVISQSSSLKKNSLPLRSGYIIRYQPNRCESLSCFSQTICLYLHRSS